MNDDGDFVDAFLPAPESRRQTVAVGTVFALSPLRVMLQDSVVPVLVQEGWTPQLGDRVPLLRIGPEWLALRRLA